MRFWKLPKPVAITIASYELLALATGKLPTISQICSRYPPVGLLIIAWLIDHLFIKGDLRDGQKAEYTISQTGTPKDQQRPVVLRLV